MSTDIWFQGWENILRIVVFAVIAYAALVFILRSTGKRTLSKMNAFDLVITISIGSMFATLIISRDVPLADGLAGLLMLVLLQYAVTWLSIRFPWWRNLVKAEPKLLFYRGRMIEENLAHERVTPSEVYAAMRGSGRAKAGRVEAVILETDGSFSVIPERDDDKPPSTVTQADIPLPRSSKHIH